MTHPQIQEILEQLKRQLLTLYNERLEALILFGSQARKEARLDSDIDILIVLKDAVDVPVERKKLSDFLASLCLEYDVLIICLWSNAEEWKTQQSPLMLNVRQEGILV